MFRTPDTPGAVVEKDSDAPKGDISPSPLSEFALGVSLFATDTARQLPSLLGLQLDLKLIAHKRGGGNPMVLETKSRTNDTGDKHESTLHCLGFSQPLNSKLDSCFQAFSSSVTAQILVRNLLVIISLT